MDALGSELLLCSMTDLTPESRMQFFPFNSHA